MIAANIRGWRFWQVDERIYWLYKPKDKNYMGEELKSRHALLTSIWRFPPEKENPHPAPFPLALPIRCIFSIMDDKEGGLIIDPYCGSGTTLIAAKILKHHFIGIDISPEYVELSLRRLQNYKLEEKYAQEEMSKHIVVKTFKERKQKGEFTGKYSPLNNRKNIQKALF
jgi:modification methylase